MSKSSEAALGVVIGYLLLISFSALFVMFLWYWVIVAIFALPVIDYWLALGLYLLCGILFKGYSTKDK